MRIEPPSNDPKFKSSSVKGKKTSKKEHIGSSEKSSFLGVFEEAENEAIRKTIEEMISDVVEAGNDFVRSPTSENLKRYKEKIKNVLKYVEKNLYKLAGKYDYALSQPRLHIIVEQIDERLEQLTNLLIEAEKNTLKLAEKVGEINGIIFDLYK
ncbi:hypothetical protein SAMN04488510_10812 [Fervidobacterium changbaicum]|uniref:DUF327 domain-containing protein n=1 Tax=Fervidobacterium changbaicum TaxID=310769 RepID=A0ABX5QPI5_9BACT|nr:YaaR family protein [Fervidobacterium changbaicum]QAV32361.1 DUF327 domain-containing protein [Fervidobacterium changbaicum]SDH21378.1 hypothetical protein SAMN04488510_10812 [Fervidobacterium changbaicum]